MTTNGNPANHSENSTPTTQVNIDTGGKGIRIRPDVWKLDEWDEALLWYARAIAEMQRRPITDPTSWRFQAAIHAYNRAGDPFADSADQLPSTDTQQRFWNQCQHGSWYFLPWHRMYLGYFEQIVAATVVLLGGPAGWSLPYWNYSDEGNVEARRIPLAFHAELLPDGSPNPLRVPQRVPAANSGDTIADDVDVDVVDCLDETAFVGTAFGDTTGFGGPQTAFNHSGNTPPGKLEKTPHGDIHVAVGGSFPLPTGFMSRFNTAGLDPLFWLHHANLDRLWTVWNKRKPTNANPTQRQWLDEPRFHFHDASGSAVVMTSGEVADSETSSFGYRYEDESDPIGASVEGAAEIEEEAISMDQIPAEMVGATESNTTLEGGVVTTSVRLQVPTGPAVETETEENMTLGRVHLNIENIKGVEPVPHLVYINLPDGAEPSEYPERLVGSLSMFGLPEASGEDPKHAASGLHYSLDITKIVGQLGEDWTPDELRVTLVPKAFGGQDSAAAIESEPPSIEIGRISVYRSR